ncbi:MAG: recombinase family protein [Niabella sp.]
MKKAILYAQVSTDRQAEEGYSRDAQIAQMRSFCKNNNLEIVKEYLEDYSAKNFDRPAFNEILTDLKSKRVVVETMVVPKLIVSQETYPIHLV